MAGLGSFLRRRLSRITTTGKYVPEIDGLRFVAILWVVLLHIYAYTATTSMARGTVYADPPPTNLSNTPSDPMLALVFAGHWAVQLFFVISGYILGLPFVEKGLDGGKVSLGSYFVRRLTRLEPPYIVAMVGLFVAARFLQGPATGGVTWKNLVASCFYLHALIYHQNAKFNFAAWSLEVEVQFYALLPLLGALFVPGRTIIRRAVLVAGIILPTAILHSLGIAYEWYARLTILGHVSFFLTGVLLADLAATSWRGLPRSGWWDFFLIVTCAGAVATHRWLPGPGTAMSYAMLGLCGVAVAAALRGVYWRRFLSAAPVAIIGGMCYSIYLTHLAVISMAGRATIRLARSGSFRLDFLIQGALLLGPVLFVGAIFFVLLERPCMKRDWPSSLMRRLRTILRGPGFETTTTPSPGSPSR